MNKRKIEIITILSAIALIVLVYFFNPLYTISQEFGKLDSDQKHIVVTTIMAILGGSLFVTRNKVKGEFLEKFESIELLLLIIVPSTQVYEYIIKNSSDFLLAVGVYFVGVMIWFFIVITRHKPLSDSKKEKKFNLEIVYMVAVFLSFGFFVIWQGGLYSDLLKQIP